MAYVQKLNSYNPIFGAPEDMSGGAVFLWGFEIDGVINTPYTLITPTQCSNLADNLYIKPRYTSNWDVQTHILFYTIKTVDEVETITPYYGDTIYNYLFNATKKIYPFYFANSTSITEVHARLIRVNDGYYYNWVSGEFQASLDELELTHIDNPLSLVDDVTNVFYGDTAFTIPDAQNTYIFAYRYVYPDGEELVTGELFSFTSDDEYSGGSGSGGEDDNGSGETNVEDGTPASKVHVGLYYRFDCETLRAEGGSQQGTAQHKHKRITKVDVRFFESTGIYKVGDLTEQYSKELGNTLFTGDDTTEMPINTDKDGYIKIYQDTPTPLNILSITPTINIHEP